MSNFLKLLFIMLFAAVNAAYAADIYYCPMHPHYQSDKPGNCPICGMTLVKKEPAAVPDDKRQTEGYAPVVMTQAQEQMMGVQVLPVRHDHVVKTIRVPGDIAYDLDLYKAEQEYVNALIAFERLSRRVNTGDVVVKDAKRRLQWLEWELRHMGATQEAIEQLRLNKDVDHGLLVGTQLGKIWVYARIFESDLGFVDVGQKAIVEVPAYAQEFKGIVRSIDPIVDASSRTIRVRIELQGVKTEFKPNMAVNVTLPVEMDEALIVPSDAVMDTGIRKMVYVKIREGVFEPREIHTGMRGDHGWAVTSGLKEGEEVAVNGNFLIDSESRLQAVIHD